MVKIKMVEELRPDREMNEFRRKTGKKDQGKVWPVKLLYAPLRACLVKSLAKPQNDIKSYSYLCPT